MNLTIFKYLNINKILSFKIILTIFFTIYFCLFYNDLFSQTNPIAKYKVKGLILDAENNETLKRVTISVIDTKLGTFSNLKGEFEIGIPYDIDKKNNIDFNQTIDTTKLRFSMIGYETQIENIILISDTILIIKLKPAKIETDEAIVYAEDPGIRLMRKVIARKLEQKENLNTYSYTLYTKFVASTDTSTAGRRDSEQDTTINSILESFSLGYYKKSDKYFNQIIQKRQSVNVPPQANFVAFGTNINAYDDFVSILGEEVYTPFHPDAVEFYDFEIIGKQKFDNKRKLTKIKVTPKSEQRKLFTGYIYLDEEALIPYSVEFKPNVAVRLPLDAEFNYNQDFELYDSLFVLPSRMRIYTTLSAEILWIFSPRLDILIETAAYDYKTNIPLDNDIFESKRTEIAEGADVFDEEFWNKNTIVPLREEENLAYKSIRMVRENPDSVLFTNYINRLIAPITAQLSAFNRKPFTGIEDLFRYNRVAGFSLGMGLLDDLGDYNEGFIRGYYSFGLGEFIGRARLSTYFDKNRKTFLDISAFNDIQRRDEPFVVPDRSIGLLALMFKNDYGDYYRSNGVELATGIGFGQLRFVRRERFDRMYKLRLFYRDEVHNSMENITNFSIFGGSNDFRWNPESIYGRNRSVGFELFLNYNREIRAGDLGLYFSYENSNPQYLKSDFDFQRFYSEAIIRFNPLPLWLTNIRLSAGMNLGDTPAQKFFSTETSTSGLAASGVIRTMGVKEFYGDKFASLYFEQNFGELIPGLFRIPNVASFGLEFIGFTSVVYTEINNNSILFNKINESEMKKVYYNTTTGSSDNIFYEVGFGLNRLLIFFRTDFTLRMTQVSKPQLRFTLSTATF